MTPAASVDAPLASPFDRLRVRGVVIRGRTMVPLMPSLSKREVCMATVKLAP
jgi:hypothetical protein